MTDTLSQLDSLQVIAPDAGSLFSRQPSGRMIKGFATQCSQTPTPDPSYLFHDAMRELVVWFMSPADVLYLYGPTGSGNPA
ncbi:MAG TPA: hypothetical protein VK558_15815 [Patescibacteria group bacterium]|nr:hypothetical protein [Patescibacteria group bacterium]